MTLYHQTEWVGVDFIEYAILLTDGIYIEIGYAGDLDHSVVSAEIFWPEISFETV